MVLSEFEPAIEKEDLSAFDVKPHFQYWLKRAL
jgi:hypothetical protein